MEKTINEESHYSSESSESSSESNSAGQGQERSDDINEENKLNENSDKQSIVEEKNFEETYEKRLNPPAKSKESLVNVLSMTHHKKEPKKKLQLRPRTLPPIEKKVNQRFPRCPSNFERTLRETMHEDSKEKKKESEINVEAIHAVSKATRKVEQVWALLVFLCVLYNFFCFFYYLGLPGHPTGISLVLEIFSEILLVIDSSVISYLYLKHPSYLSSLTLLAIQPWLFSEKITIVVKIISSYPQHTFNVIFISNPSTLSSLSIAALRILKLARNPEIWIYLNRQLRVVSGKYGMFIQGLQYLLSILVLVHAMGQLWLTLIRMEPEAEWLYAYGYNMASYLDTYVESVFYVISNMGGMCFSEAIPISLYERLYYCAIVFVGCTSLAALFGNLANSIYISNAREIENSRKLEQFKHFASTRMLPEELKIKIKSYYSNVHLEFSKYKEHTEILKSLPSSLRNELTILSHVDFIQQVKIFQLSDTSFITAILNCLTPMVCMAGDHIVRKGELAEFMYFIKTGIAKVVCADDETVVISYLTEGSYFGEIGLLLQKIRSTSVIAHTNCTLLSIEKQFLLDTLSAFDYNKHFLEQVGRQRLETTEVKDLIMQAEETQSRSLHDNTQIHSRADEPEIASSEEDSKFCWDCSFGSRMHLYECLMILSAILWNLIYTFFALCFDNIIVKYPVIIVIDVLVLLCYVLDTLFQYFISNTWRKSGDKKNKEKERINLLLVVESFALFPIDYLYFAGCGEYSNWLRFFRFLKLLRLIEVDTLARTLSKSHNLYNIIALGTAFIISTHIFGCILYSIALAEYERGGNFKGDSLFTTVVQSYASFDVIIKEPISERYVNFLYLSTSIMSSNIYGDFAPATLAEKIFVCLVIMIAKLYLAFLYAEVSNYISSFYGAYLHHKSKTSVIVSFLKFNNIEQCIIDRILKYREILWDKFKGIDDQAMISGMPETLRKQTQLCILEHLVKNADVIPKDDYGAVISIIQRLSIVVYPQGEFIITDGEIALEMYFVIEGLVDVYSIDGKKLTRLTAGKCFGEMALLKSGAQVRGASVYCVTHVSVAVLKKKDFIEICEHYPLFKKRILETVEERERQNNSRADDPSSSLLKEQKTQLFTTRPLLHPPRERRVINARRKTVHMLAVTIEDVIKEDEEVREEERRLDKRMENDSKSWLWYFLLSIQFCAALYNILFIPLQVAFRIEYTAVIYCTDVLVLTLHMGDIIFLIKKYRKIDSMVFSEISEEVIQSLKERKWNPKKVVKNKKKIIWNIVMECFTLLPFTMILQNIEHPLFIIFFVKMVRVLKIWPIQKLLGALKKQWLNAMRIVEVLLSFFLFSHILACSFILMMYVPDELNESWVRRVPFPIPDLEGFRKGNDINGISNAQLYEHAIYFAYNTISHLSIGDVCAVNFYERIIMIIYISISIFVYVFLFANITSMVTDIARGHIADLQQRYEEILAAIKGDSLPSHLLIRIKDYFDYLWVDTRGIDDAFLNDLPDSISTDIRHQLYKHAIDGSVLFKNSTGNFDKTSANSFLKQMNIRKYMKGDVLIKAGSKSKKFFLLLEGELLIIGVGNSPVGIIRPGFPVIMNSKKERINRSKAYLVATKISTVGVATEEGIENLSAAFPNMAKSINYAYSIVQEKCEESMENYLGTFVYETTPEALLEKEYAEATSDTYRHLLQESMKDVVDEQVENFNKTLNNNFASIHAEDSFSQSSPKKEIKKQAKAINQKFKMKRFQTILKFDDESDTTNNYYFHPNSKYYYLIYFSHLINILITVIITPLYAIFLDVYSATFETLDILCITESIIYILIRLRTAVIIRGPSYSYDFSNVFSYYLNTGFVADIFGLMPFNSLFPMIDVVHPVIVIAPLCILRMIIVFNAPFILSNLALLNYRLSSLINVCALFAAYFILWHSVSSIWYLVNTKFESDQNLTWEKLNKLEDEDLWSKYIYSAYYTIKIVAGVGSSDSAPCTTLERVCSCIMVHIGDILFAVVFGMIAGLASASISETEEYLLQRKKIDQFAKTFKVARSQKEKVWKYLEYVKSLAYNPGVYRQIKSKLPVPLAKEIAYETNKHYLLPMFESLGCVNFLMQISYKMITKYYLPGDYIVNEGAIGSEMYFLVDGRVGIVAVDKHTVLSRLHSGQYFGEIALFLNENTEPPDSERIHYVQAETHCCVCILLKSVVDDLLKTSPILEGRFIDLGRVKFGELNLKPKQEEEIKESPPGLLSPSLPNATEQSLGMGRVATKRPSQFALRNCKHRAFADSKRNLFEPLPIQSPVRGIKEENENLYALTQHKSDIRNNPKRRLSKQTLGKNLRLLKNTELELRWTLLND